MALVIGIDGVVHDPINMHHQLEWMWMAQVAVETISGNINGSMFCSLLLSLALFFGRAHES